MTKMMDTDDKPTTDRGWVAAMVADERQRQDAKWGKGRNLTLRTWLAILMEEVGEVAKGSLEHDPRQLVVEELVQVAAVAQAAAEDGIENGWPEES